MIRPDDTARDRCTRVARVLIAPVALALLLAGCGDRANDSPAHADSRHGHGNAEAEGHDHAGDEGEQHDTADSTRIAADIAAENGIVVAPAGPGEIADEHEVQGLLTPLEGRVAKVTARFPGPIRRLAANVGDAVRAGQTLATVESNLSLTEYAVTAPLAGTVLARQAELGAIAGEGAPLFEIADLSRLTVDLHLFGGDAQHIQPGAVVHVTRLSDGVTAQTVLERVLPGTATASQSTVARATVANTDGSWRPGSAVRARITVAREHAALVVPLTALQTVEGRDVVFVRSGDTYTARAVRLGNRDAQRVAVLDGLAAGEPVVVEQSYLVKADIEKAGAAHEH